jgi:hypothetical protein
VEGGAKTCQFGCEEVVTALVMLDVMSGTIFSFDNFDVLSNKAFFANHELVGLKSKNSGTSLHLWSLLE